MRLIIDNNAIGAGRRHQEPLDLNSAARVLIEQGRHPILARILAFGGWAEALNISTGDAKQAGCDIGLFS